ncbi:MAG TPA: hypothetical protein VKN14_05285 [Flavobacteriaceae bacterium]|nr:hypothetical protein [Flavobacteriaceae bacterium]
MVNENGYSDIFIIYVSEQLLNNLEVQFGDRLTRIDDPELYNPFYKVHL